MIYAAQERRLQFLFGVIMGPSNAVCSWPMAWSQRMIMELDISLWKYIETVHFL